MLNFIGVLMNKKLIWTLGLIGIIGLILFIKDISRYRFGYFVEGPELKYQHSWADVLKLEDGNVLVLGANQHEWPNQEDLKTMKHKSSVGIENMIIKETPSELYITNENKFIDFKLPNDILYQPKGILLKNNKLLLTFAYDPNNKNVKYTEYGRMKRTAPFPYDSMAIIDLKTKKVEKIARKKININKEPYTDSTIFELLENGKVVIIDTHNDFIIEVYDPDSNISEIVERTDLGRLSYNTAITKGKDSILIFGKFYSSGSETGGVLEYNDSTKTIKLVGQTLKQENPMVKKVSDNKILIVGEEGKFEIYNTDTNTSKVIAQLLKKEERDNDISLHRPSFAGAFIDKQYFLITGGNNGSFPFTRIDKTSEVLDLEANKVYMGPNMIKPTDNHKSISLSNGDVLLVGSRRFSDMKITQLFKRRGNK